MPRKGEGKSSGRLGERRNSKSSKAIGQSELLRAIESLYHDEICPHSRILKRRLVELKHNSGLRTIDIASEKLYSLVSSSLRLRIQEGGAGDWMALLCDRPANFVDVHNPSDAEYPPEVMENFGAYIASLQDPEEYRLPSSRYACALELQRRELPFFVGYSLGRICHIVQLAISQKSIFGYSDGALVPYAMSRCLLQKQHAEFMVPCVMAKSDCGALPLADWPITRVCIAEIMEIARCSVEGAERLANIKRIFRSRYHLELSETMLGHTKLSELLQDEQLHDLCYVELRNGGYAVVPADQAPVVTTTEQYCSAEPTAAEYYGDVGVGTTGEQYCNAAPAPSMDPMHVNTFGALHLNLAAEPLVDPTKPSVFKVAPWQLSPSKVCKDGDVTRVPGGAHGSTVKNTFIDQISTPMLRLRKGCQPRARSVPKDMFSRKSEWESACHILSYQNCPVRNERTRTVSLLRKGSDLGLNVVLDGDSLLVDDVGPGVVDSWNALHPDEPITVGDRILEVNSVKGDAAKLLEQCKVADTLVLLIQPSVQATARSDLSDSQTSAASAPPVSVVGEMCGIPLQTPSFDNYTTAVGYSYHSGCNAGFDVQSFAQLGTQMIHTAPSWLQANDGPNLTLDLDVANAADLCGMPVETPTLDRHVPAMHVSCRAADTSVFDEQSSEQPVVRSWIASEPVTLSGDLSVPDVNGLCCALASELPTQDVTDFCSAPMAPDLSMAPMAPDLSMKIMEVNDLCGMPLETPTLDRYAPTVAIRGNSWDQPREGLKLSLADYLL
jgi:hypothetical protein